MKHFIEKDQEVLAILNSRLRQSESDVILSIPLSTRELKKYQRLKKEGKTDSRIFKELYPQESGLTSEKPVKVSVGISELSKKQIIRLIHEELRLSLPSLHKMKVDDLRKMLHVITELRRRPEV